MPRGLSRARRPPVRTGKRGAEHTDCAPARKGPVAIFTIPRPLSRAAPRGRRRASAPPPRRCRRWRGRASPLACADRRAGRGRAPRSRRGRGRCDRRAARPRRPRRGRRRARRRAAPPPAVAAADGLVDAGGHRLEGDDAGLDDAGAEPGVELPAALGERREPPGEAELSHRRRVEEPGERGRLLGGRGDVEVEAVEGAEVADLDHAGELGIVGGAGDELGHRAVLVARRPVACSDRRRRWTAQVP